MKTKPLKLEGKFTERMRQWEKFVLLLFNCLGLLSFGCQSTSFYTVFWLTTRSKTADELLILQWVSLNLTLNLAQLNIVNY